MNHNQIFAISAQGMSLERTRVEVATLNLANAHTLVGADGSGFQPLQVVARMGASSGADFASMVTSTLQTQVSVEPTLAAPRKVHEPSHPLADERGFIYYPAIDPAAQMMSVMSATRAYEANVAAMNAARAMAQKALEIGGRS